MFEKLNSSNRSGIKASINGTVHWCRGDEFVWSSGSRFYLGHLEDQRIVKRATLPCRFMTRIKRSHRLLKRLFRVEIRNVLEIEERKIAICTNRSMFHLDLDSFALTKVSDFPGPGPLRMGFDGSRLLYGEYFTNRDRNPVNVWTSTDLGVSWHKLQTFTDIRHVHGVFYDPYRNQFWMTSGDLDHESHLRCSSDLFSSYETIYSGKQLYRIIELVFFKDHMIYGTDTPLDKNHIVRIDRDSNHLTKIESLPGSVFYLRKTNAGLFCTTAVEPSEVNHSRECEVWFSQNGASWIKIASFTKDRWSELYFQFGRVHVSDGLGHESGTWISPIATQDDGKSFFIENLLDVAPVVDR